MIQQKRPSLSPEKSFFLILPIALRLRLINRGGLTMYAPMDCQRLALKAPYRSTLKIRFYSFVALGRKAQGIEHDPPVIKYTPVAIRERKSALVGRSGMRQLLVAEGKKEQTEGSKPMTTG